MNENEIQLKVQALVDGELTGQEAKEWRSRLETDARLKELHAWLTGVRGLMTGAELPRTLPESGDFHWSQISEAIRHEERETKRLARPASGANRLLRWVVPLAGVACLVLLLTLQQTTKPDLGISLGSDHELELSIDDLDVMTFNTGDDTMSVVWLDYSLDLQQDEIDLWLD
tara:strand:+ start:144 stop:659 length:516 start_codon:yes stop_codon:yes gene_type:complete